MSDEGRVYVIIHRDSVEKIDGMAVVSDSMAIAVIDGVPRSAILLYTTDQLAASQIPIIKDQAHTVATFRDPAHLIACLEELDAVGWERVVSDHKHGYYNGKYFSIDAFIKKLRREMGDGA
jgi:hypothetical protein